MGQVVADADAAVGPEAPKSVLRNRNFRLLWIGETTSAFGTSVSRVALPLIAVVTLDASTFEVGLLTATAWLPWLLLGLPAGAWVDRLPRRPLMLACNVVSLATVLSAPIAYWAGVLTIAHLLLVALLTGAASVFFQTSYQVFLPSVVNDNRQLPAANAALQGSESVAQVAGPGLAGAITQAVGAVFGLGVNAITFLVSSWCLLLIKAKDEVHAVGGHRASMMKEIRVGLRFVRRDPYLRAFTLFGALSNIALTGYQAILVVFLVREVGTSAATAGLLISAMSVGGVLGASLAPLVARRFGTARGLLLIQCLGSPFALLIPMSTPGAGLSLTVVGGVGVGVGVVAGNVIKGSFRQSYTPAALLGRVVATMHLLNYGTIPLGALLAGALGTSLGLRATMWIMAVGLVAAVVVLLVSPIRRRRDLPLTVAA
ncbi:MFS transporter [Micromonospora rubida]|uniref:MFS transporter n=1 Tax=Micromonospora rubida TaxID=2697657 RepID=A0ABW7STU8_9ACTN